MAVAPPHALARQIEERHVDIGPLGTETPLAFELRRIGKGFERDLEDSCNLTRVGAKPRPRIS